jgi:hypothetical protein
MIWLKIKYKKLYTKIIDNAIRLDRVKAPGLERHHIIPKSLGGPNTKDNLVYLTTREHYIAHVLLTKLKNPQARSKMFYALCRMKENAPTARAYDRFINTAKKSTMGKNNPFYGKKHSSDSLSKISGTHHHMYGKSHSTESRDKMSQSKKGRFTGDKNPMFGKIHPPEWRATHSRKLSGSSHFNFGKPAFNAGRKWINNQTKSMMVSTSELESYLASGWIMGRLPKKV